MSSSHAAFSPRRREPGAARPPSEQDQAAGHAADLGPNSRDDSALSIASSHIPASPPLGSPRGVREPIRSYIHASLREELAPVDSELYARTVRQDTAELASYLLSDGSVQRRPTFLQHSRSAVRDLFASSSDGEARTEDGYFSVSQTVSPPPASAVAAGPSILSNLLKTPPAHQLPLDSPESAADQQGTLQQGQQPDTDLNRPSHRPDHVPATENTPLLPTDAPASIYGDSSSIEGQKHLPDKSWARRLLTPADSIPRRFRHVVGGAVNVHCWDGKAIWQSVVMKPLLCMPAVAVGLLLNMLDALSYGMILFPLGVSTFAHLGSAGISIFYVSTIISQVVLSSGSIFKGAVGSQLIEVVPFFHNMAQKILDNIGPQNPEAVIATTITAYALSSVMTGLVFFLIGHFKFGFMVGFIPRHILIGCIGGVGWFLIATGFEISARMDGSLEYNLDTLRKLAQPDTLALWICPLVLAIILFYGQARVRSKYFLPLYILAIPLVFYTLIASISPLHVDGLRNHGWIFQGPPPGEPWWYFYTLYNFKLVRWDAIAEVVPAMLALTFFGILHVPINVPALALNSGEDHADLDKELKLHGYSNILSGCLGSVQNYLVYANTVFFMRSGGDHRLAGFLLAALSVGLMMIGPSIIKFIPVMMVGTLIFDLGFELLLEAVWLPRKKLLLAEYLTVVAIVLVMGIYDFVVGIGVGILLAFVSLIIQTSRISAIRGTYDGEVVSSTVRRNPSQHQYLHKVGRQIYIMKLTGYLFFGTIVSVEEKIRSLLEVSSFSKKPIRFLILDLWHVSGLDYSAGEAFNTISRLLDKKGVLFLLSGVDAESQLGRNLRAVGLGTGSVHVKMLPNLNSALESCENELLKTLYARQEELAAFSRTTTADLATSLDVPFAAPSTALSSFDPPFNSPRQSHLVEAARQALKGDELQHSPKWQAFNEPLRLMLQIFHGLSEKKEDFWFRATPYFSRREYAAGTILFRRGEQANGFYLVERGILRAEYDLPQGWLCENIVAGTTCGELPFFSDTERTATAQVDGDCVVWLMDGERWNQLQKEESDVAGELLKISLKLTSERMSAITSYVLAMAG